MRKILTVTLLVLIVLPFAGCEEKEVYGQFGKTCDCGAILSGTYIMPHYWFECAKCGNIETNTECKTVKEFYKLVDFKI